MTNNFNSEPIMLHHQIFQDKIENNPSMIEVTQRLAPELYEYEFPPRSRIMAIEENIQDDEDEFFDESSFTTISTDHRYDEDEEGQEELEDLLSFINESFITRQEEFISDHQLSPLQLPCQYISRNDREESYDSTGTIKQPLGPSSFLSAKHRQLFLERVPEEDRINWDEKSFMFPDDDYQQEDWHEQLYQSVHPYQCSEDEEDDQSNFSTHSKVILMKISKFNPPVIIHSSRISYTDEGYDDHILEDSDCKERPIESASVFLPLSDPLDPDHVRTLAATKIQAAWRGYRYRRQQTTKASHRVLAGLAHIHHTLARRQRHQTHTRLHHLEQRLNQETAMRVAFEKAMEDMTILMDHQHKVLHERLEQEVGLRQTYEQKMEEALHHIQPLESRLRHEAKARADMESMMSRVLDQLHELKTTAKQEVEARKGIEKKLEEATAEIAALKKSHGVAPSVRASSGAVSRAPSSVASRAPSGAVSRAPSSAASRAPSSAANRAPSSAASRASAVRTPAVRSAKSTVTHLSSKTPRSTTPSNIIRRTMTPSQKVSSTSRAAETIKVTRKL
ncbi:hypothetical protein G6F42_002042 [Rhizopus arrhizus]|nr:hypothetical protein G6F42_002042 [Rhizopus arrhizus]